MLRGAVRLLLTGGFWAPLWGKFVSRWAEHPTPGVQARPIPARGLRVGAGVVQPWEAALLTQSFPQGRREIHTSTFPAAFTGLCGSLHTLHLHQGAAARGQREKYPNTGPEEMGSPLLGETERQSSLSWTRRAGKPLIPPLLIAGIFLPSHPGEPGFHRHCCRDARSHPISQLREGVGAWGRAAEGSRGDSGVGTQGFVSPSLGSPGSTH